MKNDVEDKTTAEPETTTELETETSSTTDPVDTAGSTPDDAAGADEADEASESRPTKDSAGGRRLSVSVKTVARAAVVLVLAAAIGVLMWFYLSARGDLANLRQQLADNGRAEQTALDYAVQAAIMDYKDLGPWKQKLVAGTTPELAEKLTKAADAMEQIVLPLQWTSTAKPMAAKVRSHDNGVYVVDAFVSVMTKTVQATESLQSTATYSVTINPNDSWHISDVGGIGTVAGGN